MKVSESIETLVPYKPGKSIEETKREFGLDIIHKLASNESPIGVSEKVIQAIRDTATEIHRYPDPTSFRLGQALSNYYGVGPEALAFGNGSDELIGLLVRIYCEPGDSIMTSEAAFISYKISAKASRVLCDEVPMADGLKFDLAEMQTRILSSKKKPKLVFIANPNNPTGSYLSMAELEDFLNAVKDEELLVVLDEAYNEFVRAEDYADSKVLLKKYKNVVVLKTLSKVYGLAGLRIGAAIAQPEVISYINRVRSPFNINRIAQEAAIAAISDTDYLHKAKSVNWQGLDYIYEQFDQLGLKYWKSQTNFVLFDCGREAQPIFQALLQKGVILRPVTNYGLPQCLRMSVGLPAENEAAIEALRSVLS